ncbi:glycerol acyltransferase [Rhodovarius crocodyli]|uniref:Glycerol acyltransferase n=1 Tax=Rhodovarius crocodyli TaxID=1979269 RepID=A0A437MH85_9PROT|nr:lysophospholipid acyltransferase family protein [Rhodovarius crocodyli]RVT97009.1 glycerol acyltransferase [Rhodovarius crocodyli]
MTPGCPLALRSPKMVRFFEIAFTRRFTQSMTALRLAQWGMPQVPEGRPLVVLASHAGWWDGVMFMLLHRRLMPGRPCFSPMDAAALGRYGFMRRIGVFGVEQHSPRGAAQFLRAAETILADPWNMLWINAPGRFADPRERPLPLAPGVIRLAEIAPDAVFLPLAMEYPFWSEAHPEALAAFGPPIEASALLTHDRDSRARLMSAALAETMDRLANDAISRDPARFDTLLQGRAGMGGVYGGWQYLRALLRGEKHDPRHGRR